MCQEGRENAHFRAHCFGQICFGPKQCKAGNTIKIGVAAEIAKKAKMTPFFGKKVFFDMVEKVGCTNCVFEKLCFLKTQFYSVFSKTQLFKNKTVRSKKQKIDEK